SLYASNGPSPLPNGTINTGGVDQTAAGGTVPLNSWTHLAVTYDGATLRLYVNGIQTAAQAVTGSLLSSTAPLRIGGDAPWGEYFSGTIDEVRVYNRALSAAEIQVDMIKAIGGSGDVQPPTRPG